MLSPPFPSLLNCSSRAAASRMLSPNPNPSPSLLLPTGTGNPLLSPLPSPRSLHLNPRHLQTSSPKPGTMETRCLSSAIAISSPAAETESPDMEAGDAYSSLVVVSFYRFADLPDHAAKRKPLRNLCEEVRVSGGIILAPEGINGSLCGTRDSVEKVLEFIQADERLKGLRLVESPVSPEDEAIHHGHTSHSPLGAGEDAPFRWDHVRVKVKKEIVSFGDPSVMPTKQVGKYVHPKDWNELISDPDTMVIDVRNTYETRIGKFKGAVDPSTTAFRKFPSWVDHKFKLEESKNHDPRFKIDSLGDDTDGRDRIEEPRRQPRVAMYCTGGIRCEKASSFLLSKGFEEVYHLEGGILKYLEEVPKTESLWEGECFVFDKRVSVEHGLVQGSFKLCYGCKQPVCDADMEAPGSFKLCYGCKQPVCDADMEAPEWEYGVSCPYCFSTKSEEEKERARARQRQFETWGVIGGPDKGRRNPARAENGTDGEVRKLLNSI